jgi:hypothetical protein
VACKQVNCGNTAAWCIAGAYRGYRDMFLDNETVLEHISTGPTFDPRGCSFPNIGISGVCCLRWLTVRRGRLRNVMGPLWPGLPCRESGKGRGLQFDLPERLRDRTAACIVNPCRSPESHWHAGLNGVPFVSLRRGLSRGESGFSMCQPGIAARQGRGRNGPTGWVFDRSRGAVQVSPVFFK